MGFDELIEGLRKEADEKVRQVWSDAEAEAGKIREEAAQRVDHSRGEYRKNLKNASDRISDDILFDAERKSREIILLAEKRLSDFLYSLASSDLHSLRNGEYGKVFSGLAGGVPPLQWEEVRVNPEDAASARDMFPGVRIVADTGISGGLEVRSGNCMICINDTFEKRLERAWESMLPLIMQDVCKEVSDERSPSDF